MKFQAVVLASLASSVAAAGLQMDFNIRRGDDRNSIVYHGDDSPKLRKRDGQLSVSLSNQQTFYLVDLDLGSNKDQVGVLLDTGSSDLWVMSSDLICEATPNSKREDDDEDEDEAPSPTLQDPPTNLDQAKDFYTTIYLTGSDFPGFPDVSGLSLGPIGGGPPSESTATGGSGGSNTCTSYGSFNTGNSDSFKRNTTAPAFSIEYADGTKAQGVWGYDTAVIGNTTVNNLSFAVVNDTSSNIGVLGIGLPGLETTYSNARSNGYEYENLPLKLKNEGIIAKNAYSIYLGDSTAKTGTILFGAVDHAKYSGTLSTVPIINTLSSSYNDPIRIEIVVSGITVNTSSSSIAVTTNNYGAILDTGSTLSYFPTALLSKFAATLNAQYSSQYEAYLIDCTSDTSIQVTYNFSGQNISVPLPNLLVPISRSQCYLGVLPQSSSYVLLGDNFLRSAYVVFDLEDYEVSLAPVKYSSDTNIEAISSSVPSATQAQLFSSTSVGSVSEASATKTATFKSGTLSKGSSSSGTSTSTSSSSGGGSRSSASIHMVFIWPLLAALGFAIVI